MIKAFTKKIFNFFGYNVVKFDRNFYGLKHENFELKGFTYPPGINDKGEILGTDFIFKKKINIF